MKIFNVSLGEIAQVISDEDEWKIGRSFVSQTGRILLINVETTPSLEILPN